MKRSMVLVVVFLLPGSFAQGGILGFGDIGFRGHAFDFHRGDQESHFADAWRHSDFDFWGGHHGVFGGHGHGYFGGEGLQLFFERKFEHTMSNYDDGVTEVEDFYNSEEYEKILNRMDRLIDHHDLFLMKVERSIEWIGDWIVIANDDLMYYQELLDKFQENDDEWSEKRLMKIEDRLMHAVDRTTMKIDKLTMKQAMLTEDLATYQAFHVELTDYLDQIVADGMQTEEESSEVVSLEMVPLETASLELPLSEIASASSAAALSKAPVAVFARAAAVPEPSTCVMLGIAAAVTAFRSRQRRGRFARFPRHGAARPA